MGFQDNIISNEGDPGKTRLPKRSTDEVPGRSPSDLTRGCSIHGSGTCDVEGVGLREV
jgi:hypothetical protein